VAETENAMQQKKQQLTRLLASQKAYVRSGPWADKNWRVINAELGVDTNNAEPLFIKNTPQAEYERHILFTFDISKFRENPFNTVFFQPSFSRLSRGPLTSISLHLVDADAWSSDTVTWNTKPAYGELLSSGMPASGLCRVDLTDITKKLLAEGKDVLSFAMTCDTETQGENVVEHKTSVLVATDGVPALFKTELTGDDQKDAEIWAWAKSLFDDWMVRYEKLKATGLAKVKMIESDPAQYTKKVQTAGTGFAPAGGWTPEAITRRTYDTRTYDTLDDLGQYSDYNAEQKFDKFGGLMDESKKQPATGFFYSKKVGDRWWFIDPLGYPCHVRCMHAFNTCYLGSKNQTLAAIARYGSYENWLESAAKQLKDEWYFNIGDTDVAASAKETYFPIQRGSIGFASRYGAFIGSNNSNGGSTTFSQNNTMNVFDPGFVDFCEEKASFFDENKDNPQIIGYTTDNELPMDTNMLYNYLTLDCTNPMNYYSYAAAWTWICQMIGRQDFTAQDITPEHCELFRGFVWDRYYNVTTTAIRHHDKNHMILGTRFLTTVKNAEWVLRFACLYLDAMTINWYGQWEPDANDLYKLCERADLPIMVTEFYTKAIDSGLANTRGAGWVVPKQCDRAAFYQGFTLRLLECKNFVGWHWHQYIDDDPAPETIYRPGTTVWRDQSNIDANKGIVNSGHKPYDELTQGMAQINKNVYRLIEHFDAKYAD
jgi:hypothetical protein